MPKTAAVASAIPLLPKYGCRLSTPRRRKPNGRGTSFFSVTVACRPTCRRPTTTGTFQRVASFRESRRMNLNNDVVYRCPRLGPLDQLRPGRSRSLIRHHDRLHRPPPCVVKLGQRVPLSNL